MAVLCDILSVYLIYVVDDQNCLLAHEDSHKHTNFAKCCVPVYVLQWVINVNVGGVCVSCIRLAHDKFKYHACVKSVFNYKFHRTW